MAKGINRTATSAAAPRHTLRRRDADKGGGRVKLRAGRRFTG